MQPHPQDSVYQYPPSPAYRSRTNMSDADAEEIIERGASPTQERKHPTVHYPEGVKGRPASYFPEETNSRPASIAATDDEYDYDWSGEEDLGDEEAKFEQRMGFKAKDDRWTVKR